MKLCRVNGSWVLGLLLSSLASSGVYADPVTWLERGSSWRFFPGLEEASSPDTSAWRRRDFVDGSWDSGEAPIGYGEADVVTDLSLETPPMEDNYSTVFLRRSFELPNPNAVVALEASIIYDDGFALWINGVLVASQNDAMPPAADALATASHEAREFETFELPNPDGYLVAGTNVVAVQVFNRTLSSSDAYFDMDLVDPIGIDETGPVELSIVPTPNTRIRSLDRIEIVFDESVQGVDASDLRLGGVAASSVTGVGAGPYVFQFAPASPGEVQASWRAGHGITDLSPQENAFGGGSYSYEVDPDAPLGRLIINEFLASNQGAFSDEDGSSSDWIELLNDGEQPVNTSGWALSDDLRNPAKFVLPPRDLQPGEFLVVFASGKDRRPDSGEIHADFKLNAAPDYLGLFSNESPRRVASEFSPTYPLQRANVAYGRTGAGTYEYLTTPTPGASNAASLAVEGIVADPLFSHPHGYVESGFDLRLSGIGADVEIWFTQDGSLPAQGSGTLYTGPIRISGSAQRAVRIVRAIAVRPNRLPSNVVTRSYLFAEQVLRQPTNPSGFPSAWPGTPSDYEMDPAVINTAGNRALALDALATLPALSIVGDPDGLFSSTTGMVTHPSSSGIAWERAVSAEFILPGGSGTPTSGGDGGFQIDCGMRVQGGSSTSGWKSKKTSFRLAFRGDYGSTKLDYRFFEDSPVDRFDNLVLDAHLNLVFTHPDHGQRVRAQYVRDMYVSDLQLATGSLAPHSRLCNLYINGLFWGVYDVHERPDDSYCSEYIGGAKDEWDIFRHQGSNVIDGEAASWNAMMALVRQNLSGNQAYLAAAGMVDVVDLSDYMLVNFWAGNTDWPHHNWFAGRQRVDGGVFRFFSWDAEHVLKGVNDNRINDPDSNTPGEIFGRLRTNAEFRLLFADRVRAAFGPGGPMYVDEDQPDWNPLEPDRNRAAALYMRRIAEIDHAMVLESARWGDVRREPPYTREETFLDELDWLLDNWFPNRTRIVLGQLRSQGLYPDVDAPFFSLDTGEVPPGSSLTISRPSGQGGTIWFTTDGSDPREFESGDPSPGAAEYSGAIPVDTTTQVLARIREGGEWSALSQTVLTVPAQYANLRVSELMYHAASGGELDFIELTNTGAVALNLSGMQFVEGLQFSFAPGTELAPGEFLVLVADETSFSDVHGGVVVHGVYEGSLDNSGERLTLVDALGATVLSFRYSDELPWPIAADGFGHSLTSAPGGVSPDEAAAWRTSSVLLGTPGRADAQPTEVTVLVNEVLSRSTAPFEDAIELHNTSDRAVDVSGWLLSDDRSDFVTLRKFRIPDGTTIAAGASTVFYEADFNADPGSDSSFALDGAGDQVWLASGDLLSGDVPAFYITGTRFEALEEARSWGRVETSVGPDWTTLSARSFGVDDPGSVSEFRQGDGAPNAEPLVGPVVIHEIHYNPASVGGESVGRDEFIELYNPTGEPVDLYDVGVGRGWQLRGVRDARDLESFTFPEGASIAAGGFVLIAPFDPEVFRERNGVPASVVVYGPYGGGLDNGGESLRLLRPAPQEDGEQPWHLVDRVVYGDSGAWPTAADGGGPSLERRIATDYGNEPENWGASEDAGGTPGRGNSIGPPTPNQPPQALFTATPMRGEAPLRVTVDASGSSDPDGEVVSWQWNFGDGETASGRILVHTFDAVGEYDIRLTVRDNDSEEDTATLRVTVTEVLPNEPPVPSFTIDPPSGEPPLLVIVDATASTDADGEITRYSWDFGDGGVGLGSRIGHRYQEAGVFTVTLEVEDDDGARVTLERNVVVGSDVGGGQLPGDCNQDAGVDISDAICFLGHLFLGSPASLACGDGTILDDANIAVVDVNGDLEANLSDAVFLLGYLFQGNSPPAQGIECRPVSDCPSVCGP